MSSDAEPDGEGPARPAADEPKEKKRKKKKSEVSKRRDKKKRKKSKSSDDGDDGKRAKKKRRRERNSIGGACIGSHFPFEYQHILAPMVGASELAFRLLCRKYGASLAYTPMMSASQFVKDAVAALHDQSNPHATVANSDICEFQTIPEDRPLAVHFSANNPEDFAKAAKLVEPHCDAVDLNLGCPQRTAYLGHFGSYLLGDDDRELVLNIVRAGSQAVKIPIFVKIRLLDTIEETVRFCHQLRDAGASLIAIHARYRASWERTGPGARDGPAMLDQVARVKESMPDFPIISNGNVITYEDVVSNKKMTGADGIMSAEGILNNPALYLGRLGDADDGDRDIQVPVLSSLHTNGESDKKNAKAIRKLQKKLREIDAIKKKVKKQGEESINEDQRSKLRAKKKIKKQLKELENDASQQQSTNGNNEQESAFAPQATTVKLSQLFEAADNKLALAREYLSLVKSYPMKIRSVVFHTRRMCKELLEKYQLMEECIACTTIDQVEGVLTKCERYITNPETFHYDRQKAARDKEALARKRREEGKRKAYEARMMRKAKREGLSDLEHYLRIGAEVPTVEIVKRLKRAPKEEQLAAWSPHKQHCLAYHLEEGGCKRDRACAFLHVEAKDKNKFVEDDEVAG